MSTIFFLLSMLLLIAIPILLIIGLVKPNVALIWLRNVTNTRLSVVRIYSAMWILVGCIFINSVPMEPYRNNLEVMFYFLVAMSGVFLLISLVYPKIVFTNGRWLRLKGFALFLGAIILFVFLSDIAKPEYTAAELKRIALYEEKQVKAEETKLKAAAEIKAKEKEDAADKAAAEKRTKEEEAKAKADAEAKKLADEEKAKAKEEAKKQEEAKVAAEAEKKKKEEEAKAQAEADKIFSQLYSGQIENKDFSGDKTYISKTGTNEYFFVPSYDFDELLQVQEKDSSDLIKTKKVEKALSKYKYETFDNDDGIFTVLGDTFNKMVGEEKEDLYFGYDIVNSEINVYGYLSDGLIGRDEDNFKRIRIENLTRTGNELVNDNELVKEVVETSLGSWLGKGNEVFDWYQQKQKDLLSPTYYTYANMGDYMLSSGFFIKEFKDYEVIVRGMYVPSVDGSGYSIIYEVLIQHKTFLPIVEELYEKYN